MFPLRFPVAIFRLRFIATLGFFSVFFSCNPGKIDITLSPAVLSDGYVGQAYSVKFTAGGGAIPYTFIAPSQGLPPGLAFAQVTSTEARLEGTPQIAGNFIFQIGVCDAFVKCVARGYLLKILPPQGQTGSG